MVKKVALPQTTCTVSGFFGISFIFETYAKSQKKLGFIYYFEGAGFLGDFLQ